LEAAPFDLLLVGVALGAPLHFVLLHALFVKYVSLARLLKPVIIVLLIQLLIVVQKVVFV